MLHQLEEQSCSSILDLIYKSYYHNCNKNNKYILNYYNVKCSKPPDQIQSQYAT